jgi:transglutaminase-like putative cysteine protease
MSTTLQRPSAPAQRGPAPAPAVPQGQAASERRNDLLMIATLALMVAACLPLARVYVGLDFLRPVLGAVLLSLGLAWGAHRLGAGPLGSLGVSVAGWVAFVSAAFFTDTLAAGILPTGETVGGAVALWIRGLELMRLRPAPAFAEAGLMFITVSGVWAVSHAVEGLVMRLGAPVRAISMALLLWTVPLAVAPPSDRAWAWTVPFLAAAALLVLTFAGTDLRKWGTWVPSGRPGHATTERSLLPTGGLLAVIAIVAGSALAGALPGFGEAPWYQVRGMGGTTLTTNPIVDIRTRLVAQDSGPVMRVTADRPVYLRTTSLDVYSDGEEWTNAGIRGAPVDGTFPFEVPMGPVERVRLEVEVANLPSAVLVPAPYQALTVSGPLADSFQYDRTNSTVTLDAGTTLQPGDLYAIVAAIPAPTPDQLDGAAVVADPRYTQLPDNVPVEVSDLASQIIRDAEATTPFEQALAVQNELRSWTYSVDPPQGHGGQAMLAFIDNRIGYCEQYAGTMAVMLRSLGLPTRVAVGYTPGDLVDADSSAYVISNANAHAWVEVLFDGLGWVAFEPTPRGDGNVLVPTAANVAPSRTVAQADGSDELIDDLANTAPQGGDSPERPNTSSEPTELAAPGGGGAAGDGTTGGGLSPVLVIALALFAAAGTVVVLRTRSGQPAGHGSPLQRVLHARDSVEQLGRGLGLVPAAWETDHEYLSRVAHRHGEVARGAAGSLAAQAAAARYAQRLNDDAAVTAEQASARLHDAVLTDRGAWERLRIEVRGRLSSAVAHWRPGRRR